MTAGPSCANVSTMFVRAPETAMNFGGETTLNNRAIEEPFSRAYRRGHDLPVLNHSSYYSGQLRKDLLPYSYPQLAAEYPCIVVRTYVKLNATTSLGLLEMNPQYCEIERIHIYTVGIDCAAVENAYAKLKLAPDEWFP
jgi:hypothetical protein